METTPNEQFCGSLGLSHDEFARAFESLELPEPAFRHADHVRLAWIYVQRMSLLEAIERFTRGLRAFAAAHGAPGKYHETITWAFMILVNERLQDDPGASWEEFVERNADLLRFKGGAFFDYYDEAVLSSELARRVFVLPHSSETPALRPDQQRSAGVSP